MGEYCKMRKVCHLHLQLIYGSRPKISHRHRSQLTTVHNRRLLDGNLSRVYREYPSRQFRALAHRQEKQRQREGRLCKERERKMGTHATGRVIAAAND